MVLVCPMKSAPVLLTLSDSKHVVLPVDDDSDLNVVASFDRRGEFIYTGNAKGKVRTQSESIGLQTHIHTHPHIYTHLHTHTYTHIGQNAHLHKHIEEDTAHLWSSLPRDYSLSVSFSLFSFSVPLSSLPCSSPPPTRYLSPTCSILHVLLPTVNSVGGWVQGCLMTGH